MEAKAPRRRGSHSASVSTGPGSTQHLGHTHQAATTNRFPGRHLRYSALGMPGRAASRHPRHSNEPGFNHGSDNARSHLAARYQIVEHNRALGRDGMPHRVFQQMCEHVVKLCRRLSRQEREKQRAVLTRVVLMLLPVANDAPPV